MAFGVVICKLSAENIYFIKARKGLEGTLEWLNTHLTDVRRQLPAGRDLSLFEVSLFCLIDHLTFRPTVPISSYGALISFIEEFGRRPSAKRTAYCFDA
jgi:hypothetical protein